MLTLTKKNIWQPTDPLISGCLIYKLGSFKYSVKILHKFRFVVPDFSFITKKIEAFRQIMLTSIKNHYQTYQIMDLQHYIEQIEEWLCIKAKKHTIIVQACIWIRRMQEDKILALRVRMIDLQENAPDNWIYTIQIMRRQNHPNWHMFSLQVIAAANKANIFSTTMSIVILSSYHIVNNQIRKWDGHDMIINNY